MNRQKLIKQYIAVIMKWIRIVRLSSNVSLKDKVTTILQMQALLYLRKHSHATVGELAGELNMSSPAAATFIDRLFDSNWITREDDPHDRRITRLVITKEGKTKLALIQRKHFEQMNEIVSLMPEADLKEMIRIMETAIKKWEENKYES